MGQVPGRKPKPMAVQEQKRRVHRSNAEKAERRERESQVQVPATDVCPPSYLRSKRDRERFDEIAGLLKATDEQLCTRLDEDTLARYVLSEDMYVRYTRMLDKETKKKEADRSVEAIERLQRVQNVAWNQVTQGASLMGLNVSSRLRFDLRKPPEEPKENKFAKFAKEK